MIKGKFALVVRLLQLSDIHLFKSASRKLGGINTDQSFRKVIQLSRKLSASYDGLLISGDLSQDDSPSSYRRLKKILLKLQAPVYVLPGNHDHIRNMKKYLLGGRVSWKKHFSIGNWVIHCLNSHRDSRVDGEVSKRDMKSITNFKSKNGFHELVALHHPPVSIESAWLDKLSLKNKKWFQQKIYHCPPIKAVLFGHIHQEFKRKLKTVTYFGCPSTCLQFKPKSKIMRPDRRQPGFRILNLFSNGKIESHVYRLPAGSFSPDMKLKRY